jgi:toxin ParE1/3/4
MKPEYSLNLAPKARADIRTILRSSRQAWGEEQRDIYARQITDAMAALTQFPHLGRLREELRPGLRAHAVGQHIIYYLVDMRVIRVARVLHSRVDAAKEFAS